MIYYSKANKKRIQNILSYLVIHNNDVKYVLMEPIYDMLCEIP